MKKILLLLLLPLTAVASYFQGPDVAGHDVLVFSGSCPQGYAADTAAQGLYIVGKASNGTVGNSLGSAMTGASPPDTSYTPVGTNGTVSFTPAGTNGSVTVATTSGSAAGALAGAYTQIGGVGPGSSFTVGAQTFTGSAGTVPAETFTGTANTTMRSTVAPAIYAIFCKKN